MIKISAVIITLNEEKNIGRCIDSLQGIADEILVVDSFSTDRTESICKEKKVRFVQNKWEGYVRQKNYANNLAVYKYILSLDADEALSDQLKESILEVKKNWSFDSYGMNRLTNYCGKWIRHCGWYPDCKLRLFDREKGQWEGHLIHEGINMNQGASNKLLKGALLHYSYYSISQHMVQANHYSDLAAQALLDKNQKAGYFKLIFHPIARFLSTYFIKLGFLDGFYGFIICQLTAHATFLKYAKLRQLWKSKTNNPGN